MKQTGEHSQWEALLVPYFDNQLPPSYREQMSDHVRHCSACQAELQQLIAMRRLLRQSKLPATLANHEAAFWQRLSPHLPQRRARQRVPHLAKLPSFLYVTVVLMTHLLFFGWIGWVLNQTLNLVPLQMHIPDMWQGWLYAFLAGPFSLLLSFFAAIAPDWAQEAAFVFGPTLLFLLALAGITWLYFG